MRRTPRQELIDDAARRARNGRGAHLALEAVVSECKAFGPGTLGAAMLAYYRRADLERLIKAVERKTK